MTTDWNSHEVAIIVTDYFEMLELDLRGRPYSKKEHWLSLLPRLSGRSKGAIEFKHQNISSVLAERGEPFIDGYKPLSNYQQLLQDEVISFLHRHERKFEPLFDDFAMKPVIPAIIYDIDFAMCLTPAPPRKGLKPGKITFRPAKINYLEKEQNNRILGAAGEEFVLAYERWRLEQEDGKELGSQIEWTSNERGDGLGYDIRSKNADGSDRYIEVKTTKLSEETPIYITSTEIAFAAQHTDHFYLYRIFHFAGAKHFFIQAGSYADFCELKAITYKGYF